ncbi:MAG TPA: tail fiber domain-containing protein [Usitatibacter sp.]|nr:tail fiber domain-containing protein [Usitatibacter sp.]
MLTTQMSSDRLLKQDWVRIGTHPLGVGIYLFDYKPEFRDRHGHGRQFGVMADEVERVLPAAVTRDADGYRRVDYAMLGIRREVS